MDSNTFPALDASADAPPHDEYCARLLAKMPAELQEKGCFCQIFTTVRADEDIRIEKAINEAPDLAAAKKALQTRTVQNLLVALMPSGR